MSIAGAVGWNSRHDSAATSRDEPQFVDIGKVILTPNGEPVDADVRDTLTMLSLPDGTLLQPYGPSGWYASWNNGFQLTGQINGEWVFLLFRPQWVNFERQYGLEAARVRQAMRPTPSQVAPIVVRTSGIAGRWQPRKVKITTDGHVFVAKIPVSNEAVVNSLTGEVLDLARARRVGQLWVGGNPETTCRMDTPKGDRCFGNAYWPGRVLAPADGLLRCVSEDAVEFASAGSDVVIRLSHVVSISGCVTHPAGYVLSAGDPVTVSESGYFRIEAYDQAGNALSTGVALDGTVWVGVAATVGCPCVSGGT